MRRHARSFLRQILKSWPRRARNRVRTPHSPHTRDGRLSFARCAAASAAGVFRFGIVQAACGVISFRVATRLSLHPRRADFMATDLLQHSGLRHHEFQLDHHAGNWVLHNSCAIFDHFARLQLVSLAGDAGVIHGFSEYRFGFIRLASVRTPASLREHGELVRCEQHEQAFAIPFLHNNLYHSLHHAVPAFESWQSHGLNADTFVPLIAHSTGIGRKVGLDPSSWHAWEFTLRALTSRSGNALAKAAEQLLMRSKCTCFGKLYGSTGPFTPASPKAAPRVRAWAQAVLRNSRWLTGLGADSGSPSTARILYVQRRHTRRLVNVDVDKLLSRCPVAGVIELETLSLSNQLALVARAQGMISAHGQSLALLVFLNTAAAIESSSYHTRAAVIEILPPPPISTRGCGGRACARKMPFHHMYKALSESAGVRHAQLLADFAPPCNPKGLAGKRVEAYLQCNLTIAPKSLSTALQWMRRYID